MPKDSAPPPPNPDYRVNFLFPRAGYLRREVLIIWIMLAGWALFTFGFQILLRLTAHQPSGEGPLTESTFIGFPFHYWFTGQFLIVWFIFLCLIFNLFIDRLTKKYRRRK